MQSYLILSKKLIPLTWDDVLGSGTLKITGGGKAV